LESQIGVRTSICPTLHAKCYLNENEAIVTSMNLYSFSQQNNDEMGIYVSKDDDPELYKEISNEVQRLLTISEEVRVTIKKIDKRIAEQEISIKAKSNYKTTKEISELSGISSREINALLVNNKLMYKKDEDWVATKKGIELGGISKEGQYGKFIVWPEEILRNIKV
jgi:phosphatidylserine/phosphatidylglycerophosphate/cardiolipin synthase-like enzyme